MAGREAPCQKSLGTYAKRNGGPSTTKETVVYRYTLLLGKKINLKEQTDTSKLMSPCHCNLKVCLQIIMPKLPLTHFS